MSNSPENNQNQDQNYQSTLNVARIANIDTNKPIEEIEKDIIDFAINPPDIKKRSTKRKIIYPIEMDQLSEAKIRIIVRHLLSKPEEPSLD